MYESSWRWVLEMSLHFQDSFFFQQGPFRNVFVSNWAKRRNKKEEAGGLCKIQGERRTAEEEHVPRGKAATPGREEDPRMFCHFFPLQNLISQTPPDKSGRFHSGVNTLVDGK